MDFSKFSDSDFEVKKWVNEALKTQKDSKTPLDGQASMLVMKLQLFIQEVSNSLDESSVQVVQSLPRVLRDVEAVKQETILLREQMRIVKEDIKQVERETSNSMQRLVELDNIKTRMKKSQNALQEADNWTTLSADVEDVFASQDIQLISEKVIGMHQSLSVLHDVPDYKERHKLLESLKNRLEALLVPLVMVAFNNHQTDEANFYSQVFSDIGREKRTKEYYTQCHKNYVQLLWSELLTPNYQLLNVLTQFYESLLSKWMSELSWCNTVFPSPLDMLGTLFKESLNSLTPPIGHCLHIHVSKSPSPVDNLIILRNVLKHFLINLQQTFKNTVDIGCHGDILYSLVESFHVPYCQLLVQYGSLQQQVLMNELTAIVMEDGSPEDVLQSVSLSIPIIINIFLTSIESSSKLTDGWGVNALIKSIETVFLQYTKQLTDSLYKLRVLCGLGETRNETGQYENESSKDQWINLKWAFQFIKHCGDLVLRLMSLNSQICSLVRTHRQSYLNPAGSENPFGVFDYLRTFYPEEHTAVTELYNIVEQGDSTDTLLLTKCTKELRSLTDNSHTLAFDILFAHLKRKLTGVPLLKVWQKDVISPIDSPRAITDDLPTFSRSPLPYITEIGDYLLTLPQQIEPFTSMEDPALVAAMENSHLPYINNNDFPISDGEEGSIEHHSADKWLFAIAQGTMETYVKSILEIPKLNEEASQQLATDIGYLCNVLAALDQQPTPALTSLEKLLKAPDKQMFEVYRLNKDVVNDLYKTVATQRTFN